MNKLPENFELDRYGLHVRLVREEDAEFIVNVRTHLQNARYLGYTDPDVAKQIAWLRDYKKREAEAKEYYFIFFQDDKPIVLCRLYNIDWVHLTYTSGSWVSVPGTDFEPVMKSYVIIEEIAHNSLGLLVDIYDVRKGNVHVLNFHRKLRCAQQYGETDLDYLFMSTPESQQKSKLKQLLGL